MKIVKHNSQPLSNQELSHIKHIAEQKCYTHSERFGLVTDESITARERYIEKVMSFVDVSRLQALKIVINSGNGAAGPTIDALKQKLEEKGLKTNFFYVHHNPDPNSQMVFLILCLKKIAWRQVMQLLGKKLTLGLPLMVILIDVFCLTILVTLFPESML